jgi:hypothetical protein
LKQSVHCDIERQMARLLNAEVRVRASGDAPNFLFPVSKLVVCTSPTKRPEVFDSLTGNQFQSVATGSRQRLISAWGRSPLQEGPIPSSTTILVPSSFSGRTFGSQPIDESSILSPGTKFLCGYRIVVKFTALSRLLPRFESE